eukprot:CAMPEP_0202879912 /NCGR_PEP_ID=MMETSP1391-20130828/34274_1 /ASSEMBLY_ACC=CAM_ASM_000867 /TAXON_ID=1034604 /ORGANISM="Chlamydomonas leiostraca, Strain SAG 11-49" /LENGTH=54 /DNA_ID=CAMNT_0049562325 /DNA_START=136 /DNA_END=297 /DNA_ORIENTATION=-
MAQQQQLNDDEFGIPRPSFAAVVMSCRVYGAHLLLWAGTVMILLIDCAPKQSTT